LRCALRFRGLKHRILNVVVSHENAKTCMRSGEVS
jgi:hypothetical protein